MDLGNKTLAQLSEEAKEKRYVTLEVGSKISGYTKDYLERLCRLNKIEYRLATTGQFVVEIEALLRETHTILLSYQDINFVDKGDLSLDAPQIAPDTSTPKPTDAEIAALRASESSRILSSSVQEGIMQAVPSFGEVSQTRSPAHDASTFSFIGRTTISDVAHPEVTKETETAIPIALGSVPTRSGDNSSSQVGTPLRKADEVVPPPGFVSKSIPPPALTPPAVTPPPAPVSLSTRAIPPSPKLAQPNTVTSVKLPVVRARDASAKPDEWDAMVCSVSEATVSTHSDKTETSALPTVPVRNSLYHPIKTAIDATVHHDDAPLFPKVGRPTPPVAAVAVPRAVTPPPVLSTTTEHPGIPDLGSEKRVVVFAPETFGVKKVVTEALKPKPAPVVSKLFGNMHVPHKPLLPGSPPAAPSVLGSKESQHPIPPRIPSLRVMPPVMGSRASLPMLLEEHHLAAREDYRPTKSLAFNAIMMFFLFGAALFFGGGILRNAPFVSNSVSYVANVGDALFAGSAVPTAPLFVPSPEMGTNTESLPFSDEVQTGTSTQEGAILIQPIFRDTVGRVYQYAPTTAEQAEAVQ